MDDDKPTISLVNEQTNVIHRLHVQEMTIGRGWLECDDKRISRKHAVLRIMHTNTIIVLPLHQNPMFFKRAGTGELLILEKGNSVQLVAGDSFGLLPDLFWFCIRDNAADGSETHGSAENAPIEATQIVGKAIKATADDDEDDSSTRTNGEHADSTRFSDTIAVNAPENRQLSAVDNGTASLADGIDQSRSDQCPSGVKGADGKDATELAAESVGIPSHFGANISETPGEAPNTEVNVAKVSVTSPPNCATSADPGVEPSTDRRAEPRVELKAEPITTLKSPTKDATSQTDEAAVKQEERSADDGSNASNQLPCRAIKTELADAIESGGDVPLIRVKQEFKTEVKPEPMDVQPSDAAGCSGAGGSGPVSPRPCCRFGVRCYRRNPLHRGQEAHPGDPDYTQPDFDELPANAPPCPFGALCYRRNPTHFQQFWHPKPKHKRGDKPTTTKTTRKLDAADCDSDDSPKKRPRFAQYHNSDPDEPDAADPFAASGDELSEYNPDSSEAESSEEYAGTEYDSQELRAEEEASARADGLLTNSESADMATETPNDEESAGMDVDSSENPGNSNAADDDDGADNVYDADTDENE